MVGVNTSPDYINPSGTLDVIAMADKTTIAQLTLPGQPDSVAVSKEDSGYPKYIAIAIENERDEDLEDGSPPQMPPGYLEIITIADEAELADPSTWNQTTIDLTGFPECRFSDDPEPEYVAINDANDSVLITLQENNCNILVDPVTMTVTNVFDAGEVSLTNIDTLEEDIIRQNATGTFLREPDGATWLGDTGFFATANEGDLDGGSRGWTIFDSADGSVIYDSGNEMDIEVAKIGHYPDGRSGNKGNEPENVLYVEVEEGSYIFVLSERSNVVFVYEVSNPTMPGLLQVLPSGVGPEGIVFDYDSKTLAVTAEKDDREKGFRSSITFFSLVEMDKPFYPTLESMPRAVLPDLPTLDQSILRADGDLPDTYIPFSALSGLAASKTDKNVLFTVEDGEFRSSRILSIDKDASPASVFMEDFIMDDNDVLSDALGPEVVNADGTVNLDLEGIASDPDGGFWVVSKDHKALIFITADHVVEMVVMLTVGSDNLMGVELDGDNVVVIQGKADDDKPNPLVVVYNTVTETTKSAQFVLEASLSQYGDEVGLTDIAFFDSKFYILQTDPYGGKDAGVKRIDCIDLGDYSFADDSVVTSELFRDLIPDLTLSNGIVPTKLEALTIDSDGNVFVVNDNGGIGETGFLLVDTIDKEEGSSSDSSSRSSFHRAGDLSIILSWFCAVLLMSFY